MPQFKISFKQFIASAFEVIEIIIIALAAFLFIRAYLVKPFLVSGSSMVPNFSDGDYLLINELTYRFRPPARGEVIVFRYPKNEDIYFIKRVIGLPGERVAINNDKITIFNDSRPDGFILDENYLSSSEKNVNMGNFEFKVPDGQYFVLGDNRAYSFDSRSWGALKAGEIIGLAEIRLLPPATAKVFAAPQYEGSL